MPLMGHFFCMGFFNFKRKKTEAEETSQVQDGLQKTRSGIWGKLSTTLLGKSTVDPDYLDELEEILITSDVGVETTVKIINALEKRVANDKYMGKDDLALFLNEICSQLMPDLPEGLTREFTDSPKIPYVIFVVGVNGVGKTTTIGKIAYKYGQAGKKVVLGAADTYRAAAVDQLHIWKDRAGADIVSKGMNADPSAVAYDTIKYGVENNADVVIIDTAGRLHNKVGLMNELAKMRRSVQKFKEDAPHETLLVIDATTGQNAYEQAKLFTQATKVNTLAVTKLDGTAKGGVVIGVSSDLQIPVKYIGIGEKEDDLVLFDKTIFLNSIFNN
jgi:fused signal recognition particle receptor